jgi:starch phosphorylase
MDIPKRNVRYSKDALDDDDSSGNGPFEFNERRRANNQNSHPHSKESYDDTPDDEKVALLWAVLASYLPSDEKSIQKFYVHHAEYSLAQTRASLERNKHQRFLALAYSVRDRLIERWKDTELYFEQQDVKRQYYLSLEFLLGRTLQNALSNLNLTDAYSRALRNLGIRMEELVDEENDAALGNGGLGRLAACFLDSLATMNYPSWGYGLRYTYGMFHQEIKDGYQVEFPDYWLSYGNPWEIERLDVEYPIHFYGTLTEKKDAAGNVKYVWTGGETVIAVAYDVPIPGYNTYNTLNLRLWSSKPAKEFDLHSFNRGDYFKAIEDKQRSETITSVLYPNDNTSVGKELRLKQQYFFVSATLQDILKRYKKTGHPLTELPKRIAIQLNDTHPTLSIVEMMRLLLDEEGLDWDTAWTITVGTHAYTNHTVLPEALEHWKVALMQHLLPRHMKLIYDINFRFLKEVEKKWPGNIDKLAKLSLIQETPEKSVRMAHLAIVGSHTVNGVAKLHSEILKTRVFPDFAELYPNKFINVTNGVTPRRWLHQANPDLSALITTYLRTDEWKSNLSLLEGLRKFADDEKFQKKWAAVKRRNKQRLADWIKEKLGITVNTDALFDVQIKRFHEYKRQLLNILGTMYRYRQIKGMSDEEKADVVPRVTIFGGKAAPGYYMAKLIIKLINTVAEVVNNDPDIGDLLKIVFLPNYCVSLAELVIPASDISQHISTAGTEASGTSNMKFTMNGGIILGTLDGANIEIREEVGEENMFIFGTLAEDVEKKRQAIWAQTEKIDPRFEELLELMKMGTFGTFDEMHHIIESLIKGRDYYLVSVDFPGYLEVQKQIDMTYKDQKKWIKMSIMNTAGMGKFSSDRSISEYATKIWDLKPCQRPGPIPVELDRLQNAGLVPQLDPSPTFGSPISNEVSLERLSPLYTKTIKSFSPSFSPTNF